MGSPAALRLGEGAAGASADSADFRFWQIEKDPRGRASRGTRLPGVRGGGARHLPVEHVAQGLVPDPRVHRGAGLPGDQVGRVMEKVDVHQVEGAAETGRALGDRGASRGARAAPARVSGVASSGATCARTPVRGSPGLTQSTGPTRSGTRGARAPSSSIAAMAAGHSGQPDLPVRDRDGRPAAGTFRRWPARPEGGGGLGLQASRGWVDAV